MSIASRITAMEEHIGNAYDKLDELGVDLTNVNKNINNIAGLLNEIYEDYPKTTTTNVTEPSIDNTKAGRMEIDLKSNTEQTTYTGINKLPNRIISQAINGLTIVRNEDGSLKFNGTSTGGTNIQLVYNLTLQAGSYTMSLYGRTFGIGIYSYVNDELQTNAFISASSEATIQSITFTLNSDTTYNQIRLYVPGNTTLNNVTVYPLINQGSTVADYEPYTGGTSSPNPDFPQDVEVVSGENKVKVVNKNFFDNTVERKNAYINDYTIGTTISYSNSSATYTFVKCCYLKAGNTYKLSWKQDSTPASTNARNSVIIDDDNKIVQAIYSTWDDNITEKTIIPTQSGWLVLSTDINVIDIQIEESSTATTYEEHKEQDFPISLHSRNLFDKTRASLISNYKYSDSTYTWRYLPINLKPNTTYIISTTVDGAISSDGGYNFQVSTSKNKDDTIFYLNNASHSATITSEQLSFTTNNEGILYLLTLYGNDSRFETFFSQVSVQIEEGSTATTYQSFYDYELCKIGDYKDYPWKDENTGKWYIKKLTGKGNADDLSVIVSVTSTIGADLYAYACNASSNINSIATLGSVISNIFTPRILGSTSETTNPNNVRFNMGISKHTSTAQIVISILKTYLNDGQTQTFKTFLQNNNFMFRYILATPIDIEITDTTLINQLEAIYNTAKSYDDTTNITQENNDLPFILDIKTLKKS